MTARIGRRGLLTSLGCLIIAAPSIVRATSLMPIKAFDGFTFQGVPLTFDGGYPELIAVTRTAFVPRLLTQLYDLEIHEQLRRLYYNGVPLYADEASGPDTVYLVRDCTDAGKIFRLPGPSSPWHRGVGEAGPAGVSP